MAYTKVVKGKVPVTLQDLEFDTVPTKDSENVVTSGGVAESVGAISDVLPEGASAENKLVDQATLDEATAAWNEGYTPKGPASVSTLNGLSGQENGDRYVLTDGGTLSAGSVVVADGDEVAWDATNSAWYKVNQYATKPELVAAALSTPFELGVRYGTMGYLTTSTAAINKTLTKERAIFGFMHVGKGTVVSVEKTGTPNFVGFSVEKYNEKTGEFISTSGNIASNLDPVTVTEDCIIIVQVKTDTSDVTSYISDIGERVKIKYEKPAFSIPRIESNLEQGTFDSFGNPSANAGRVRTTDFVLMGKGSVIYVNNLDVQYGVLLYSMKNKGWYSSFAAWRQLPCYQLEEDALVRIHCAGDGGTSISASNVSFDAYVTEANVDILPSYYYTADYIQGVTAKINAHDADCGFAGDSFVFITDTHWATNCKKSPALIDYIKKNTTIRKVFFGGDAITSYDTKNEAKAAYDEYREAMDAFKFFAWHPVIGNHEFNNPGASAAKMSETLSASEAYALVTKENEPIIHVIDEYAYYIDNEQAKIRYIFVGTSYTSQIPSAVSDDVVDVLDNLPEGYQVLVVSHVGLVAGSLTIDSTFQGIVDKLDAMQAGSNVIGVISGHRHLDGLLTTDAGTNIIATTCDSFVEAESGLTRTRGTTTEQAFDVVQIDTTNRKIYMTRVGAGLDREINY